MEKGDIDAESENKMNNNDDNLTAKQRAFIEEYIIDLNATQAAIRAGYSEKTARAMGHENLTKPNIIEAVYLLNQERLNRCKVDADYVLNRLIEIDKMDVIDIVDDDGGIKSISEWPESWRRTISGIDVSEVGEIGFLKKIKWPDKIKNIELLGKHVDIQAFKDKVQHSGEIQNTAPSINLIVKNSGGA